VSAVPPPSASCRDKALGEEVWRNLLLETSCLRAVLISLWSKLFCFHFCHGKGKGGDCHWQLGDRGVLASRGGSAQVHVNMAFSLVRSRQGGQLLRGAALSPLQAASLVVCQQSPAAASAGKKWADFWPFPGALMLAWWAFQLPHAPTSPQGGFPVRYQRQAKGC